MADETLTVRDALLKSADWLKEKGVDSPRLDAELLLANVLGCARLDLYLKWDRPMNTEEKAAYRALLKRRSEFEPVAYILGEREFYSLPFAVKSGVLVPRPETEMLVETVLELVEDEEEPPRTVLDIGTGSGAVAVALAVYLPEDTQIIATDISKDALEVAASNARRNAVAERVRFVEADLLPPECEAVDFVVSNPPYIPLGDRESLPPDVGDHEPESALFAGEDGLDIIRRLIPEAGKVLRPGGWLAMEIGRGQSAAVEELIAASGLYEGTVVRPDHAGIDRVLVARRADA